MRPPKDAATIRNILASVGLILVLAISISLELGTINSDPAEKDARQNLTMAFNVNKHGTYSVSEISSEISPTMYREPLPNLVLAAWMFLATPVDSAKAASDLNRGEAIKRLKLINVFWASGITVLSFLIVFSLTGSVVLSLLAAIAQAPILLTNPAMINRLMTELPAACTILGSCYLLILTVQGGNGWLALAAGIVTGLAALTKALILYTMPAVALALALLIYLRTHSATKGLGLGAIFLLGSLVATGPWIARNEIVFGEPRIASRGGLVLYKRMLLDNMTSQEFRGAFYAWAPPKVQRYLGTLFGYKRSDLEPGGILQRLNRKLMLPQDDIAKTEGRPELASNFYSMMRAESRRQNDIFARQGHPNAAVLSEREMEKQAKRWIASHPLNHIALMAPLAWRAIWVSRISVFLSPLLLLSLIAAPLIGLAMRRWDVVAFSLLPVAVFALSTGVTHNIPRYTAPLVPAMIVSSFVILWLALSPGLTRLLDWWKQVAARRQDSGAASTINPN